MASIRVGFFQNFKGADTLLIDVDNEGLRYLIAWIGEVMTSHRGLTLAECPAAALQADPTRSPRDRAIAWAEEERKAILRG